jgi:hypothetical protein
MPPIRIADRIDRLQIDQLELDPENPRLPLSAQGADQQTILEFMVSRYEPIVIGRSIALHGFFPSEPLIVISSKAKGRYTVVEGNRRLVALKLLTDPKLRAAVGDSEWEKLAADVELPAQGIPVVTAESREDVAPIIGYRHIAGIQEWDPYPKARFITQFIDRDKMSFSQVAQLVGESEADIRRYYRNYGIVEQAREKFGLDTSKVEADFGVWDRALTGGIREFIQAPVPSATAERYWPLPDAAEPAVKEVISWIFGDEEAESVIRDSRSLTTLGRVLKEDEGRRVLRRTRDLAAAAEAASGTRARLLNRLGAALGGLKAAKQDLNAYKDADEVRALASIHRV